MTNDSLTALIQQASADLESRPWLDGQGGAGRNRSEARWLLLLRELAAGHLPNPDSVGHAVLATPGIPDPVASYIRQKIMTVPGPKKGGRPRGRPQDDTARFLADETTVPRSIAMLIGGILDRSIRYPSGRHRRDPLVRAMVSFSVESTFAFFMEGNSLPGRSDSSEFIKGSHREWAVEETAHEHGMSIEAVRDLLLKRKGWEDGNP